MSRRLSATDERIRELEAEVENWRTAYRELAMAIARRDGYTTPDRTPPDSPAIPAPQFRGPVDTNLSAQPTVPAQILVAIEDTTAPHSPERNTAIEAARALLESGVSVEEVEQQVRQGEEIRV